MCGELESFDKGKIVEGCSISKACLILFAVEVFDVSVYFSIKRSAVAFNPTVAVITSVDPKFLVHGV